MELREGSGMEGRKEKSGDCRGGQGGRGEGTG